MKRREVKDAARAWKDATDLTLECMNMGCLEELIENVDQIRILLENKKDCCDDNVTYFPTEEPTTEIEPGVGDPPEFYGETAISDWDDWREHVCFNANAYVDYLVDSSGQLFDAVKLSSIFLGLIAAILALLAFTGIGLPIAYGLAATIVAGLALSATATTFLNTPANFESAREDIVCAIMNGASLASAVETALSSDTDWDLFYQFVDYDAAVAIIFEGGYEGEYLPTETSDACMCEVYEDFLFTWPDDIDGWDPWNVIFEWNAGGWLELRRSHDGSWGTTSVWNWGDLEERFEFEGPIEYDQIRFKFYNHIGSGTAVNWKLKFRIYDIDEIYWESPEIDTTEWSDSEWHNVIFNMDRVYESGVNHDFCVTWMFMNRAPSQGQRLYMDNWGLYKK